MAKAEYVPLDCLGPGNLFVFLFNFLGRSNQLNSPLTANFLLFSFQKMAPIDRRMENLWAFYVSALIFVRYTLGGQENFVGMRKKTPHGLDHVS